MTALSAHRFGLLARALGACALVGVCADLSAQDAPTAPQDTTRDRGMIVDGKTVGELFTRTEPVPASMRGSGLVQRQGTALPLELRFRDELGRSRKLGDYFASHKPVILTLNYFRCPQLCSMQLNALLDGGAAMRQSGRVGGLRGLSLDPAVDFDLVTVSFDPTETPTMAKLKKQSYVAEYERATANAGWHFLTGNESSIAALCEAVGFSYQWNPDVQQFAHPAVAVVCTPDGKVSQYLPGIDFESDAIRAALEQASGGKTGTFLESVLLLTCMQYDGKSGNYSVSAIRLMRTGGVLTLVAVGLLFLNLRRRRGRTEGTGEREA